MRWIPGWDSVEGAHWWSNAYFWGSILSLILLGASEVVSHRYSERRDRLANIEQEASNLKTPTKLNSPGCGWKPRGPMNTRHFWVFN